MSVKHKSSKRMEVVSENNYVYEYEYECNWVYVPDDQEPVFIDEEDAIPEWYMEDPILIDNDLELYDWTPRHDREYDRMVMSLDMTAPIEPPIIYYYNVTDDEEDDDGAATDDEIDSDSE